MFVNIYTAIGEACNCLWERNAGGQWVKAQQTIKEAIPKDVAEV